MWLLQRRSSQVPAGVQREGTGSGDQEKYQTEEHAVVGAGFVHGGPESGLCEHGKFGSRDGDGDIDEQRDGGEARQQAEDEQPAANDFDNADKRSEELG